jgi:hypothetical protein
MSEKYTEEEIEELYSLLIRKLDEVHTERPADGQLPTYRLFDAVSEAFEESQIENPK